MSTKFTAFAVLLSLLTASVSPSLVWAGNKPILDHECLISNEEGTKESPISRKRRLEILDDEIAKTQKEIEQNEKFLTIYKDDLKTVERWYKIKWIGVSGIALAVLVYPRVKNRIKNKSWKAPTKLGAKIGNLLEKKLPPGLARWTTRAAKLGIWSTKVVAVGGGPFMALRNMFFPATPETLNPNYGHGQDYSEDEHIFDGVKACYDLPLDAQSLCRFGVDPGCTVTRETCPSSEDGLTSTEVCCSPRPERISVEIGNLLEAYKKDLEDLREEQKWYKPDFVFQYEAERLARIEIPYADAIVKVLQRRKDFLETVVKPSMEHDLKVCGLGNKK